MNEQRPVYRIAAAGLDPRDVRLIEIVFKHSQYNRFAFVLDPVIEPDRTDILIVDTTDPEGLRAVTTVRGLSRHVPVIAAVQRGVPSPTRHAISIDRLTLQLLPILNRVVETELLSPETQPMTMPMTLPLPAPDAATFLVRPAASSWPVTDPAPAHDAPADHAGSGAGDAGWVSSSAAAPAPSPRSPAGASKAGSSAFGSPAAPSSQASTQAPPAPTSAAMRSMAAPDPRAASSPSPGGTMASRTMADPQATGQSPSPAAGAAAPGDVPPMHAGSPAARAATARSNLVEFPRAAAQRPPTPRIRVLVVDDSPTVRQQLGVALTRMGLVCEMVPSGAQALERLATSHFDLAMVDIVIPDMDGYRLTREIRKRHRAVPVIILSSRGSPFDYARGRLAGCKAYLAKPVPLRQLEAAMRKVLRKSIAIDELPERLREPGGRGRSASAAAPFEVDAPQAHGQFATGNERRA